MRTKSRAYGYGTARRRCSHRFPSPPHASNNSSIRSSLLCEEGDGWRCPPGWRLYCSRSYCARRPRTRQRRRIRPAWRSNQSHRPPMRMRSSPLLPSTFPAPRVKHSDTALEQAQMASAPVALSPASGTEHQLAKKAAHHTLPRAVRKTHAFADRGSPFSIRGVLTPPDPTAWPGGGH
jgi:hypothetical protein